MIAADSDGEASFVEVTDSISQENQRQHHHQHNGNIAFDADSDSDVKLWLQHTGFFDIERRQKFLGALRKLKAIDEERSKVIDELRACTEYSASSPASTLPQSPSASEGFSPLFSTPPKTGRVGYNSLLGSQSTAFASFGERLGSETSSVNKEAGSDNWSMTFRNRPASSQQDVQNAQPSIEATTSPNNPDYQNQGADSPSSSNTPSRAESHSLNKDQAVRNYTSPQILSLVPKQESRYFLVKSFNIKNVDMSQRDGLWITSAHNGVIFANAFQHHKDVFLIFSINKSKAFQGYARMITRPQATIPHAKWMRDIPWNPSAPFRIQWLNTTRTDFWRLGDLRNPLNGGRLVFIGKDGQELPEACGREVIRVLDQGDGGDDGADTAAWMTRKRCDHVDGGEMSTWQRDDSLEEEEVVSTGVEPEPAKDMPLIDY
ncbi:YT521-B-like domain-containing protein [Trichoderma chlorosporum]